MRSFKVLIRELRGFLILWLTQSFSALGSAMTNFALIVWSYQAQGSALTTALLSVRSYAPDVVMSIFAGALSDRWNKKAVMLASDSFAALCTVAVLVLLQAGHGWSIWHLYCLNALNGLMNTVQQPAADVAISPADARKTLPESQRPSFARQLSDQHADADVCHGTVGAGRHPCRHFVRSVHPFLPRFCRCCFWWSRPQPPPALPVQRACFVVPGRGCASCKGQRGSRRLILFLAAIQFHRVGSTTAPVPRRAVALPPRRRRGCSGCRQHRYGSRAAFGQCRRLGAAAAQKPCAGGLQYPAAGHEYGKLFSCLRPQRPRLVSGRGIGLGRHPVDECQPGRADAHPHPHCHAGACVCCAQYAAVLHHSAGVLCRRPAGGQGIRAAHGPPPGRKPAVRFVRRRRGPGRRVFCSSYWDCWGAATCLVFRRDRQIWGAGMSGRGARCRPVKTARSAFPYSTLLSLHCIHLIKRPVGRRICGGPRAFFFLFLPHSGAYSPAISMRRACGTRAACLGSVNSSTPFLYAALMCSVSTPETSKLRLNEPNLRSRRR